jgi:hypothetical protein
MERKLTLRLSHILRIGAAALCLLAPACASQPQATPSPTPTVATAPAPVTVPTETAAPTIASAPVLSTTGPWIVVNTTKGLWAANPDGSGPLPLTLTPALMPGGLSRAVSPRGGYLAYLTSPDLTAIYGNNPDLSLIVLSMSGPNALVTLSLTSGVFGTAEPPTEVIRAITEHTPYAWSKDGSRLAYIGASEGPSADVYEYLPNTPTILRLTDGPNQAYDPLWSPDDRWVVHIAAAGFGTGAGITDSGIFAARADDSGVISLYDIPAHSGGEREIGWLNAHTLVTESWLITCGPSNIRLTDLAAGRSDLVFQSCVSAAAAGPGAGSVLFAQSPDTADFDANPRPGLYLLTEADRKPRLLSGEDFREIVWSEGAGAFLARTATGRLYEVSPTGQMILLAEQVRQMPVVSPNGAYWAMTEPLTADAQSGLWIGRFKQMTLSVLTGEVLPGQFVFSSDGGSLYFFDSAGNLYRAQAPEWTPALIAPSLSPVTEELSIAWVEK